MLFWGTDIYLVLVSVHQCIVSRVRGPVAKQYLLFRDAPHMAVAAASILNELELVAYTACDVINDQQV